MELVLQNVGHTYGDLTVLDDITLRIPTGQIVCLVGPSGCGKSTLLRLLGGLERPSAGKVVQIGDPPDGCINPLTYVFQDFALLPWRTAIQNIEFALEDHIPSPVERRKRVQDVLKRTNLADFGNALPKQLSGGMKQRVAIARALAVEPAVLLMDEPLSALDSQTRELLLEDILALWTRSPFTAVYVTHNLDEAVRLGHQIVLLSRRPGRIREIITLETPLNLRTDGTQEMVDCRNKLWSLLKEEAVAADNELIPMAT